MEYLLSIPKNYNGSNKVPVLLFLHGGDRSNTKHHPLKYARKNNIDFPFLAIAPKCSSGCSWQDVDFNALLHEVTNNYSVDLNSIYVTGYSMGGYGSWNLLTRFPEWFAAAAPIAGGGKVNNICKAKKLNIRAYHGDADNVVTFKKSAEMIDALKQCGGKAELILYPGVGHGSWVKVYQDPKFYKWLLDKKRK
ncbi:prolyl oligopeptidase family serine peptidase [Muricauda sp. JGD-17]|uniref:Prolyl oligopeptidase family serine peptidase n=1 Tax=Flagellimonas ochracea TaxID=2696472 RepID=A0A964TFB6_9FLAO|nr:prolyl oligopeptidase family serine peptidase [Allomuricauda ochracea]NAY93321.1 prolyl oligopeptidase family serine peptidase [Allomuricauda ochracea]